MDEIKPATTLDEWLRDYRHALAALALQDQPFGFTREDVRVLRAIAEVIAPDYPADPDADLSSIADRIAALLPPEEPPI